MFVGAVAVGCGSSTVLLQIVPLVIQTSQRNNVQTYALLDSGSQASLILESFADELGLEGSKEVLSLGTVNSKDKSQLSRRVSFAVRATGDDNDGSQFPVSEA